ncbi:hypothetical protein ASG37_10650 [Sphingomonas sp. Leaf407]|nr:hypothetical protein ASE97_07940 [Sphingomonas sp. Leaf42]KQT27862.1 hypothetical protein ASG37_10650 [Sphingomonas sp. Leaf407]
MFDMPDLSTLRQCSFLASAAYAVVFLVAAGGRRAPWMRWWALSSASYCVVLLGYASLGEPMPVWAAAPLNGLLSLSTAFILAGVRSLDRRAPFARWMWAVVAATAIVPAAAIVLPGEGAMLAGRLLLALGLAVGMLAFGWPLAFSHASDGSRAMRQTAGMALLCYIPCYALGAVGEVVSARAVPYLALVPMLADQVLLSIANLSLLAIPGMRSERQLQEIALCDPLTGVWNRAALAANEAVLRVPGRVVLLIDIDHFKAINDHHGHGVGDGVLVAIARALQREAAHDFVCRLGGDEFLVVATADDAEAVAERLRERAGRPVADLPPWSVSVGLARIEPGDVTLADAMQRADRAMYRAKDAGRGRIAA